MTGPLGGQAAAGYAGRVLPRTDEGCALAAVATAMIDLSDGIATDAARLARASGTGAIIELERLPRAPVATVEQAATGGEDYELLAALPPDAEPPVPVTVVGRLTDGGDVVLLDAARVPQQSLQRLGSLRVIPVLAGLTAAVMWGLSTVVASRSTKVLGSQGALAWVMLIGGALTLALAPISGVPHGISGTAWAWAIAAGFGSAFGLSMMYRALRIGKVGVVAPIASTEGALAALLAIALGERLTVGVAICLSVIALGIFVVTLRGSATDIHLRPSLYAMAAACSFGIGLVGSSKAGHELGAIWTILVARIIGVSVIAGPLIVRRTLPRPGRVWWMVTFSALAELIGFAAFIGGSKNGVAIPAVLASQFAAVAAATSYVVFGERLGVRQRAGAVVIFVGVAALSLLRA